MTDPYDPTDPNSQPPNASAPQPQAPPIRHRPAQPQQPAPAPAPRARGRSIASIIGWGLFVLSMLGNLFLLAVVGMVALRAGGLEMSTTVLQDGESDEVVAVYDVVGVIDAEASANFEQFVRTVANDKKVKAVVLRVESPGGTVCDSNQIHHRLMQLRESGKKIVASMGGVAASGGYLISVPADEILAEPATITGSIGVIAQIPNLEGTMDKIGVKMLIFKSTQADRWKDAMSPWRMPEKHERRRLIEVLDQLQADFEHAVRTGRPNLVTKRMPYTEQLGTGNEARTVTRTETAPLNGKVYLAREARHYGLIDDIGYLDDACRRAGVLAGLARPKVVRYEPRRPIFGGLMNAQAPTVEITTEALDTLQTPRVLMLWKVD